MIESRQRSVSRCQATYRHAFYIQTIVILGLGSIVELSQANCRRPISKAALLVLLLAITLPDPDIRSETFDDTPDFGRIGRTPAHDDDLW